MRATEVKEALRRRHPALWPGLSTAPGEWVCLEEWAGLDLVAFRCWGSCERLGYEVKVSRQDMRKELLSPHKREPYKRHVDRLYFAVPDGRLKPDELAYEQPEFTPEDFEPEWCTNPDCQLAKYGPFFGTARRYRMRSSRAPRHKGTSHEGATVHLGRYTDRGTREDGSSYSHSGSITACCHVCKGRGKTGPSRVEHDAPTLWVPPDVGLVLITSRGCRVVKQAPKLEPPVALPTKALHDLVRWASFRSDPRHRPPRRRRAAAVQEAVA